MDTSTCTKTTVSTKSRLNIELAFYNVIRNIVNYFTIFTQWISRYFFGDQSYKDLPSFGGRFTSTYELLNPILWTSRKYGPTALMLELFNGLHYLSNGKGILRYYFLNKLCLLLSTVSTAKVLLKSKENIKKSSDYDFIKPWLRNGLLVSSEKVWKLHRKLLAPTMMTNKIIDSYFHIFHQQALILIDKLKKQKGKRMSIIPILNYCTLDIIIEAAMGCQLNIQNNEDSDYLNSIHTLSSCCMERVVTIWYWPYWLFKLFPKGKEFINALNYTRNFTMNIIKERMELLNKEILKKVVDRDEVDIGYNKLRNLSFLDLNLQLHLNDKRFTLEDVCDEVETFLLGGHETSSFAMSWSLYLLGHDNEIQNKVHQELDEVLGKDPDTPVTLEQTKSLKYLECVIKEAGRLYPPVSMIGRVITEEIEIDGKIIPKGTEVGINVYQVHRDPDVYPKPEEFQPERFLDNEVNFDPYSYLTFSAGPRGCIGSKFAILEMKVVLSQILRRFSVTSDVPRDKLILSHNMITTVQDGIHVTFHTR